MLELSTVDAGYDGFQALFGVALEVQPGEAVAVIGPEFDIGNAAEEVDTVAGYIVTLVDRVPVRGEAVAG